MNNYQKYKRTIIVLFTVILVFLTIVLVIPKIQNLPQKVGTFNVSDYNYEMTNFRSEENVGSISDAKDAIEKAERIWLKIYGEEIKKEKPYQVSYDEDNEIWLVQGTLPRNTLGGVANILIENSTGKVLAVWHED